MWEGDVEAVAAVRCPRPSVSLRRRRMCVGSSLTGLAPFVFVCHFLPGRIARRQDRISMSYILPALVVGMQSNQASVGAMARCIRSIPQFMGQICPLWANRPPAFAAMRNEGRLPPPLISSPCCRTRGHESRPGRLKRRKENSWEGRRGVESVPIERTPNDCKAPKIRVMSRI